MKRTLFYIPYEIFDWPLFGFGWALAIWAVVVVIVSATTLRRQGWNDETRGILGTLLIFGLVIAFVLPWLEIRENGQILGLAVRGYGVFMLMGVVSGVALLIYRARRIGLDPELLYSMAVWSCGLGLVGARLFYVVQFWSTFKHESFTSTVSEILKVSDGGLVVYGSLFGGLTGMMIFTARRQLPTLALIDLAAPSLALGVAFGRIGCLMNGCCFGGVCDANLPAIRFPADSPAYVHQAQNGLFMGLRLAPGKDDSVAEVDRVIRQSPAERVGIKRGDVIKSIGAIQVKSVKQADALLGRSGDVDLVLGDGRNVRLRLDEPPHRSLPVHPAQIYSSIDGALLCLIALAYSPFRRRDGEVTCLVLSLYAITRFIEEMVRDDQSGLWGTPLSIAQVVSIGTLLSMIGLWLYISRRPAGLALEKHRAAPAD